MAVGPLVDGAWLAAHLGRPGLRVVDLRWYLDGRSGREAHLAGHIPGAVFLDLEEITGEGPGRHPLPSRASFQAALRRAGVSRKTAVVAYDDAGGSVAARLWWLLRLFGHPRAAVLDGGIQAWPGVQKAGPETVPGGDFEAAQPDRSQYLDFEQVAARPPSIVLLDARAPERYCGEIEPVDPQAGHIPGAKSAFWRGNLKEDLSFLAPPALRERFTALGVTSGALAAAYCGSGVNACHDLLALELAGLEGARLYAGSWSDWSRRPSAPVATGEA